MEEIQLFNWSSYFVHLVREITMRRLDTIGKFLDYLGYGIIFAVFVVLISGVIAL